MDVLCTPKRTKRPLSLDRKIITERRKSLFGVCGVSPLSSPDHHDLEDAPDPGCHRRVGSPSWSSDDSPRRMRSPVTRTPLKSSMTPVKSLQNDFTQMVLEKTPEVNRNKVIAPCTPSSSQRSRVVGATSARRSPRVLGVRRLSPDRGLITPQTFYGRKALERFPTNGPHTDGKALYQRIRESVRVRLPMETFPREKKRARSSSSSRSAKRPKKIPRYRLFEEDEPKKKPPKKSSTPKAHTPSSKRPMSEAELEVELAVLTEPSVSAKKALKSRKSAGDKPSYNWHFFNSKTPPASKMSRILGEKSSPSVLTPPPTIRKRKLISSFDLDHLPIGDDEENDENSSSRANVIAPREKGIAEQICDDFSEDENEEEFPEKNVDQLLEDLNKDVAEVLGDQAVKDVQKETSTLEAPQKLYPLFTDQALSDNPNLKPLVSAPAVLKRRKLDPNQLILDVGQRGLREVECSQCGLLYVQGDDTDEAFHTKHHLKATVLTMSNWKNARLVRLLMNGEKIVLVKSGDPKSWWDRARKVLEVVDSELGYPAEEYSPTQVYLYLKRKQVVGCLAVRPLTKANRLLPSFGLEAELCTEEEFPVRVGVSRIWVASGHRRSGIANSLVDCLRRNYTFGEILKLDDVAFSSPTEDGKEFAVKYFKREDFLIYSFAPSYET